MLFVVKKSEIHRTSSGAGTLYIVEGGFHHLPSASDISICVIPKDEKGTAGAAEQPGELSREGNEKDYWREKEQAIGKPFVYGYAKGWYKVPEEFLTLNFKLVLAVAICLSAVFSEEHVRRTDQLSLCSKNGRNALLVAKISAGVTFGMISAVLMFRIRHFYRSFQVSGR